MGTLSRAIALAVFAAALAACGLGGGSSATPAPNASGDALQRGLAAHQAGQLDEAIKLYYQALANDPSNKFAFFNLGQIEHTRNHLVSAEAWYRLALENDKNMPQPLYNLALIRLGAGDATEAASLLRRLLAVDPNNAFAHWNLGVALRALGQTAEANTEFATAQRLNASLTPPPVGSPRLPSPTR